MKQYRIIDHRDGYTAIAFGVDEGPIYTPSYYLKDFDGRGWSRLIMVENDEGLKDYIEALWGFDENEGEDYEIEEI